MMAQLSTNTASDSFLYSFTPAAVGRGGVGPVASSSSVPPPPMTGSRRLRAYSVPGEPTHPSPEFGEIHADFQGGSPSRGSSPSAGSSTSTAPLNSLYGLNPTSTTTSTAASTTTGVALSSSFSVSPMPVGRTPALGMSCCGSADKNQHTQHYGTSSSLSSVGGLSVSNLGGGSGGSGSGSAAMPVIGGGGSGYERTLPPMRHSISGNPGIGLPKLDLPSPALGGGIGSSGGGVSLDRPVLGLSTSGRRSLSGNFCDVQSVSAPASFLDLPSPPPTTGATAASGPFEGSAPSSPPRSGAPAVLAPLRVSGVFAASSAGGAAAAAAPSLSTGPAGVVESAGGGWCGGGGGGSLLPSSGSRRYTCPAGLSEGGSIPPPPGSLLPCVSEGAVASPLTPGLPYGSSWAPPRRSHSLTGAGPAATLDGGGGSRRWLGDSDGGGADGQRLPDTGQRLPSKECGISISSGGGAATSTVNSLAAKALADVTNNLQRSAGALLALHGPAFRSRSSPSPSAGEAKATRSAEAPVAAVAAAATFPPLSRTQLTALKESAPELQWEMRVAMRRLFHMLRQELSSEGSAGRQQLDNTIQEAWSTLDAYCEGTAELVGALVDDALDVTAAPAPPPPPRTSPKSGQQRQLTTAGNDVIDGGAAGGRTVSNLESEREAEKLRAANEDLRKQLEECRARLAESEARSTAAAARGAPPAGAGSSSGAAAPRPPPASTVTPPLERCYSMSPRRGKHALIRSNRDEVAPTASDGGDGASGRTGSDGAASQASASAAAAAAAAVSPPSPAAKTRERPPRRFERSAVLARGAKCDVMVIEEDDSESDDDSDAANDSMDTRRSMLTYHSASFAEWVRGARRR